MTKTQKILAAMAAGMLALIAFATPAFAHNYYQKDSYHSDNNRKTNAWYAKSHYSTELHAYMAGWKEVPGPGDPNGRGHAVVKIDEHDSKVCVKMHVWRIKPATAAHIHHGDKDESGPVVVTLPTPNEKGYAQGCVYVDEELAEDIAEDPSEYYVNVHNSDYPNGAVRGQLKK